MTQLSPREADVLRMIHDGWRNPTAITRMLNEHAPCDWCPVDPPTPSHTAASVPIASWSRVRRVLRSLQMKGLVRKVRFCGHTIWTLPQDEKATA